MSTLQNKTAVPPKAAPLQPIDNDVLVGKDILELLSSSMYIDPMTIYREYVQNSADAIDHSDAPDAGKVAIFIDPTFRTIRIRDNGVGLPSKEFVSRLTSFGASKKRGTSARGFRGVGRLAGLGYCRELVFRSRGQRESVARELVWDCRTLRSLIHSNEAIDLAAVVKRVVSVRSLPATDEEGSFFEVELRGIVRHKNDQLLNVSAVTEYLSQVAPVPFHSEFVFGKDIKEKLSPMVHLGDLEIVINGGDRIYRPHRNSFETAGVLTDRFEKIEWLAVPSADGTGMAALGWVLHHGYHGALPNSAGIKGLRFRCGDIQVGDANLLEELFAEPRFNAWSVGEIHVHDRRIIPNGRRDHFEQNSHFANLLNNIAPVAREISRRCRQSSIERKLLREFASHERIAREKLDIVAQRGAPKAVQDELLAEAKVSLAKLERLSGLDALVFVDRPELVRRYNEVAAAVKQRAASADDEDALASLPPEKQAFYREVVRLIYRHSANRNAAKSLVDRIFDEVGLSRLTPDAVKNMITKS
jgi:molecular chaperone HtpG